VQKNNFQTISKVKQLLINILILLNKEKLYSEIQIKGTQCAFMIIYIAKELLPFEDLKTKLTQGLEKMQKRINS